MKCPECKTEQYTEPDDVAIHLIDRHGWDYEKARLWLRDQVEETAFTQEA